MRWLLVGMAIGALAPAGQAAQVRAVTIEGATVRGEYAGVNDSGEMLIRQAEGVRKLGIASLMQLTWGEATATAPATGTAPAQERAAGSVVLYLADGSFIPGEWVDGDGHQIVLQQRLTGRLTIDIDELRGIRIGDDSNRPAMDAFEQALRNADPTNDRLLVEREGRVTTLTGAVESLNPQTGAFAWRNRTVSLAGERVFAVILARTASSEVKAAARCALRDGSVWTGRLEASSAHHVAVTLTSGARVELPVNELTTIHFASDDVLFLDELEPSAFRFEPFGATRWPYRSNRSVANRPMRIGTESFERGIGVHSRSTLVYTLPEGYHKLAATIGIDEAVGSLGSVVFRVLADGREVFSSEPVRGPDEPRDILVPIDGSRELQLVVDYGDDLDVGDQANWASIRLIR
jgi:hypothetical protein